MQKRLGMLSLGLAAALMASCASPQVIDPDALIVVKDVRVPDSEPWVARFARHSWVDYRPDVNSPWRRIEVLNETSGLLHNEIDLETAQSNQRMQRRVRVLAQSDGKSNPDFARELNEFAQNYDASTYTPWPGPNSNTFAERLVREVDGLSAQLDHNAVGKNYGFHAGRTAGGTGVELQTSLLGAAIGVREGIQVSVIGLSAGISFVPFSLKIPLLPQLPPR